MRQTDENLDLFPPRHHSPETSTSTLSVVDTDLSDRDAVIAVMFANGSTTEGIADRLSLPLRSVQGHLHQTVRILGVSSVNDLTYVLVASRYNRGARH